MDYSFNLGWLFGGLGLILVGGLIVIFYKQIADNLVNGVSSYDKTKLVGVITAIVGMLMASNLLPLILTWIAKLIFQR